MQKIYMMADLHGRWQHVRDFVERNPQVYKEDSTLVILGDAGFNYFMNYRDRELKKQLSKYPLTYFCMRGNHEERPSILAAKDNSKWRLEKYFDGLVWVEKEFPNIKYAMDYVQDYQLNDFKTIIIPGAYSVDKEYRQLMGWSWFPHEQLTPEEKISGLELIKDIKKFDLLLSHTCPISFEPKDLFLLHLDQSKIDKSMEDYIGLIDCIADFKVGMWGHFHDCREIKSDDNKRRLMLYNDCAIDLDQYMKGEFKKTMNSNLY